KSARIRPNRFRRRFATGLQLPLRRKDRSKNVEMWKSPNVEKLRVESPAEGRPNLPGQHSVTDAAPRRIRSPRLVTRPPKGCGDGELETRGRGTTPRRPRALELSGEREARGV